MPLIQTQTYFKWGLRGKRYYYDKNSEESISKARNAALKQGKAILIRKSLKNLFYK